jgi:hypothetical protein
LDEGISRSQPVFPSYTTCDGLGCLMGTGHFHPSSPAGLGFALYAGVAWSWVNACGNTVSRDLPAMPPLTTSALSTEVLEDALLTLEQITTRITVLALNASRNPEQAPRVRILLGDLLADIQDCEEQLGTYAPLDA